MVVMVMVAVMMTCGSERRAGEHHQEERGEEKLFHGSNVARLERVGKTVAGLAPREETCPKVDAGRRLDAVGSNRPRESARE
jgi:hypothetical protein